jgi:hypothetical protein
MGIIKSKIIKDRCLLLQEYSGEIEKKDLEVYFRALYQNPEYLFISTIYSDFTDAIVALTEDDIVEIAYFILMRAPKVKHIKNAIIVNKPLVTAYSFLYKEIMKDMTLYTCKIFSTFKEAAYFINYEEKELRNLINKSFDN